MTRRCEPSARLNWRTVSDPPTLSDTSSVEPSRLTAMALDTDMTRGIEMTRLTTPRRLPPMNRVTAPPYTLPRERGIPSRPPSRLTRCSASPSTADTQHAAASGDGDDEEQDDDDNDDEDGDGTATASAPSATTQHACRKHIRMPWDDSGHAEVAACCGHKHTDAINSRNSRACVQRAAHRNALRVASTFHVQVSNMDLYKK
jgi:hypothetical protein